jgi:DNA-binding LacI/PurR family transcriptional regulator
MMMAKRRITRNDVAKRAGVSVAVVSYVINDGPRPVSPQTRAKVERAIEELGYYPNELARGLRLQQSSTIGLIIPNLTNPVYAEIARSMEGVCTQEGYLVLLGDSGRDPDREKKLVKMLRAKQVDGVVMIPSQKPMELVELLQQARIPSVILEHKLPGQHCITIDDLEGGRLGTQHLLSLGHRRIGLIRRTPSSASSSQRFSGYCQALEEAGVGYNPALVIESGPGQEAGSQSMQRLLALSQPPTAVFTHNDVLAVGAMHAIRSAGLHIPDDISVVGYDDTAPVAYLGPPLTTVRFPKEEMGRRAGEMILRLAQHKDQLPPRTFTLPVKLLVRGSTAPPPG